MDKFYCAAMLLCVIIDVHSMNLMQSYFSKPTSCTNVPECTVEYDYSHRRIIKKSKAISLEASLKQKAYAEKYCDMVKPNCNIAVTAGRTKTQKSYAEKYCDMVNPDGKTAITSNIDEGYDSWNSVGMFQLEEYCQYIAQSEISDT